MIFMEPTNRCLEKENKKNRSEAMRDEKHETWECN